MCKHIMLYKYSRASNELDGSLINVFVLLKLEVQFFSLEIPFSLNIMFTNNNVGIKNISVNN
jgi:hypothetical protein